MVYISVPQGVDVKQNQVLRLNRSLYGLEKAAATCFEKIPSVFKNMGFVACVSDSCVFARQDINGSWSYVALYVDDMLIGGVSADSIKNIAHELSDHFWLKTMGNVRFILSIEVDYEQCKQLKIGESAGIARMIIKFNQIGSRAVYNPNVQGQSMAKFKEKDPRMENRPYRSLLGSLLYVATGTRRDIAFEVCQLSRHLEKPNEEQ